MTDSTAVGCENPVYGIIAKAIVSRLRHKAKEVRPKPTIDELEKMLNQEVSPQVDILPDGSLTVELPVYARDLAEAAVFALYEQCYTVLPRQLADPSVECCCEREEPKFPAQQEAGQEVQQGWPGCINPSCICFGEQKASARYQSAKDAMLLLQKRLNELREKQAD